MDVAEQLAEAMTENFDLLEARRRALSECVTRLKASDRELVSHCYSERKITAKSVAAELNRPTGTVYKALNRIRRSLFDCINRKISAEGLA